MSSILKRTIVPAVTVSVFGEKAVGLSVVVISLVTLELQATSCARAVLPDPSGAASGESSLLPPQAVRVRAIASEDRESKDELFMGRSIRVLFSPTLYFAEKFAVER